MAAEVLSPAQERLFQFVDRKMDEDEKLKVSEALGKVLGTKLIGSMYEALCLLLDQGQITKDNVNVIKDCIAERSNSGKEIKKEAEEYVKKLPEEYLSVTGRAEKIKIVTSKLETAENAVVNLFGVGGVGKTTVAREICRKWKNDSIGRSVLVDLREVKVMKFVYGNILQALQQDQITLEFEEEAVFRRVRALTEQDKPVLVLLDNSDWFASAQNEEQRKLCVNFLAFLERLKSVEVDKFHKVRILLTSRLPFADAELVEDVHLESLNDEESKKILESAKEEILPKEEKTKVSELCGRRPLLLKTFAAAGKQEKMKSKLKHLIKTIAVGLKVEKSPGAEETESKESERGPETMEAGTAVDSRAALVLKSMFFNLLSKPLQNAAVSLSLFCHPFSMRAAAQVLEVPMDEACFLLETLRSYNFIIIPDPEAREETYDIHPLLKEVVKGIGREEGFTEVFQAAEARFSHLFMDYASRLGKNLDKQYVEIQQIFNTQRANFELSIAISRRRDDFFIREYKYHDVAMTAFLFDAMLDVRTRMKLYQSWADTAEKDGQDCLAADLRCWQALQVLDVEGSHEAHKVLEKAKASVDKATLSSSEEGGKGSEMFQLTEAKYHFALGKVYRKLYSEPNLALDEYFKSLEVMDSCLGDHTETARCLNAIGNCYQHLNEPKRALEFYKRAYLMRKKLSGEDHLDMPAYKSQIGGVYHLQGNYDKAIENFQSAIELEEKLKISGTIFTATYYRNIANAYLHKDEFTKALEPSTKAYEIRNEILGVHPETTWSLFQLGLIWNLRNVDDQALHYYKRAWEMEKSLGKGNHSEARDRIVADVRKLYDKKRLFDKLRHKKEKREFEEDALQFYQRIWEEEKSFDGFQFSPPNRAVIDNTIDLLKSLGLKEELQRAQEEALGLYEKTWKERDTLPETKWDKTKPMERTMVESRKTILTKVIELSKAVAEEEKIKELEGEQMKFLREVFFGKGSVQVEGFGKRELFKTITGKLSKTDKKEFAGEAMRFFEERWVELGREAGEMLGSAREDAIEQLVNIASEYGSKQERSEYREEALGFCGFLLESQAVDGDESSRAQRKERIKDFAERLKDKSTQKAVTEQMLRREEGLKSAPKGPQASVEGGEHEEVGAVGGLPGAEEGPSAGAEIEQAEEVQEEPETEVLEEPEADVPVEPEVEMPEVEQEVHALPSEGGAEFEELGDSDEAHGDEPSDADPFYKVETVDVPPGGLACDFISTAVCMLFPVGAVSEPQRVSCSAVNPNRCKPRLTETEALVSCVVQVSPAGLDFSQEVTLALSFSAPELRDYEVVIKELRDAENNVWDDLSTVDTRCETASSAHPPETTAPPVVKTTIRRTGTFAAICRLASDTFTLTAEGLTYKHRRFEGLEITIPAGAFPEQKPVEVQVKVQEVQLDDLAIGEVHACPAICLEPPESVAFKKPVTMSIPLALGDKECSGVPDRHSLKIRVYFSASGGSLRDWEDMTDRLDKAPSLEDDVVTFEVSHFSWFSVWLEWGASIAWGVLESAASLLRPPPLPVLFRAGVLAREMERPCSNTDLALFCLPGHLYTNIDPYKTLAQVSSNTKMRPDQKSYVHLDERNGGLRAKENLEDFFLIFWEGVPYVRPLPVRVVQSQPTEFSFFGNRERSGEPLCTFRVKMPPPERRKAIVEFFGVPITRGSNLYDAPVEIMWPCLEWLDGEALEEARGGPWDALKFFTLLAGCGATTQYKCFGEIITALSTMPEGFVHIKKTLETGEARTGETVSQEFMTIVSGSENGSRYWKQLARKLTIDDHLLNSIEADYREDSECCHQALLKWKVREPLAATVRKLLAALSDLGLGDEALEIAEKIAPSRKL